MRLLFEASFYFIRTWCAAAFIQGRLLFEGGFYLRKYANYNYEIIFMHFPSNIFITKKANYGMHCYIHVVGGGGVGGALFAPEPNLTWQYYTSGNNFVLETEWVGLSCGQDFGGHQRVCRLRVVASLVYFAKHTIIREKYHVQFFVRTIFVFK